MHSVKAADLTKKSHSRGAMPLPGDPVVPSAGNLFIACGNVMVSLPATLLPVG
jgi:hypothetical protein